MKKTWFITGASRGFGRIWTEAALERGDNVAATARDVASMVDLKERFGAAVLPLALDVTDTGQVRQAVQQAHAHFGRLDVVLNNAGYSLVGTTEESSVEEVQAMFDANFFGTLRVIQAALPLLRAQGSGHIIGVSSGLGIQAMPLIGFYCASKFAIEALHESLAKEVKAFGVKVTLVEPGAYATEFGSPASLKHAKEMGEYNGLRQEVFGRLMGEKRGDPKATPEAMFELVDAAEPPLRLFLGNKNRPMARAAYAERLATWEAWERVSNAAQGERKKTQPRSSTGWVDRVMSVRGTVKARATSSAIDRIFADVSRRRARRRGIGRTARSINAIDIAPQSSLNRPSLLHAREMRCESAASRAGNGLDFNLPCRTG